MAQTSPNEDETVKKGGYAIRGFAIINYSEPLERYYDFGMYTSAEFMDFLFHVKEKENCNLMYIKMTRHNMYVDIAIATNIVTSASPEHPNVVRQFTLIYNVKRDWVKLAMRIIKLLNSAHK